MSRLPRFVRAPSEIKDRIARLKTWYEAFSRHIGPEGMGHFGPVEVWQTVRGYASTGRPPDWPTDLSERDPEFIDLTMDLARAVGRFYFRWDVDGVHRIPAAGGAVMVGNHNGGILPTDTLLTLLALWDHFGEARAVHPLGHDLLWQDPVARRLVAKLGILRAHPDSADMALEQGRIVLVYPGSDLDSWRPWTHRGRVQLGKRMGFIRIALRNRVPVVPIVSVGTHEQFFVLTTGRRIAKRIGLKRLIRSEAFPIVVALPWGVTSGFFPYFPLPAQTSIRFGEPIAWPHLAADAAEDPVVVRRCFVEVEGAMQGMLDELNARRIPVVGSLRRAS